MMTNRKQPNGQKSGKRVPSEVRTAINEFYKTHKKRFSNPSQAAKTVVEELQSAGGIGLQTLTKLAIQAGITPRVRKAGKSATETGATARANRDRDVRAESQSSHDGVDSPDLKQTLRDWNKQFDAVLQSLLNEEKRILRLQTYLDDAKRTLAENLGIDEKNLEARLAERRK